LKGDLKGIHKFRKDGEKNYELSTFFNEEARKVNEVMQSLRFVSHLTGMAMVVGVFSMVAAVPGKGDEEFAEIQGAVILCFRFVCLAGGNICL
jgi:hypothetical protein